MRNLTWLFMVVVMLLDSSCSSTEPVAGGEASSSPSAATSSTFTTTVPPIRTTVADTAPSTTTTTRAATTTSAAIPDDQREAAEAVGDIVNGKALFDELNADMPDRVARSTCHTIDGSETPWAPTLAGVYGVAASRVAGLSDIEYLRQSILDPYAFLLDGEWRSAMPVGYADVVSQAQIDSLIAFMMTL